MAAAATSGTQVSTRERSHKVIGGPQREASTMMTTDIVNTVTSTLTGIGPLTMGIVGIEAGVRIGEGRKAVGTGQIMIEEGYRLITEVTSVTGNLSYLLSAEGKLSLSHSVCLHQCFSFTLVFPSSVEGCTWV